MLFSGQNLYGTCDIVLGGKTREETACALELDTGEMLVQVGEPNQTGRAELEDEIEVLNIKLITPYGTAHCTHAEKPLIISAMGGGVWIGATSLTYLFEEENKYFAKIRLVFNAPLIFEWDCLDDEIILTPGSDLWGGVALEGLCDIIGRKETFSLRGVGDARLEHLLCAASLTIGAPVRMLARTRNGHLTLYMNERRKEIRPNRLHYEGYPYRDHQLSLSGAGAVFRAAFSYLEGLPEPKRIGFINAVKIYLEGRANTGSYLLKQFAVLNFLEWFDDARTFSKNALVERLGVTQEEAAAIVQLRNDLIHANKQPSEAVSDAFEALKEAGSERFDGMQETHPEIKVMNYLYSVCGEVLLRAIGYEGQVQDYIPTNKEIPNVCKNPHRQSRRNSLPGDRYGAPLGC